MAASGVPELPFLLRRAGGQRGEEPVVFKAVVDAITQFEPIAEKVHTSNPLVRRYRYPIWVSEEPIESEPPVPKRYDSVVIAAAGALFFPGTEGLLSGDVVYTVYLRAGSSRDWVLQFSPRDAASPIEPPYPAGAVIPQVTLAPEVEYMVIHGVINAQGRFEKVAIVGDRPLSPDPDAFVRSLSEWEFQPATLDGGAIPVDIVLIVPNSSIADVPALP
jgi:hypothetical protein